MGRLRHATAWRHRGVYAQGRQASGHSMQYNTALSTHTRAYTQPHASTQRARTAACVCERPHPVIRRGAAHEREDLRGMSGCSGRSAGRRGRRLHGHPWPMRRVSVSPRLVRRGPRVAKVGCLGRVPADRPFSLALCMPFPRLEPRPRLVPSVVVVEHQLRGGDGDCPGHHLKNSPSSRDPCSHFVFLLGW
jgi:hypothetical protein